MIAIVVALALAATEPGSVEKGDIVVHTEPVAGSDVPYSVVEGIVDAPPAVVWDLVSRCGQYKGVMPRIADAVELSREGDENRSFTTTCKVTAELPFPFSNLVSVSKATHTVEPGVRYVRQWQLVSGDYDVNEGSWTLVAVDGGKRTRATYRIRAKPRVPLPDGILRSAQQGTLPDLIKALRKKTATQP